MGFWQDPANSFVLLLKCTFEELFEEKCLSILKAEDLLHEQVRTQNVTQYHTHYIRQLTSHRLAHGRTRRQKNETSTHFGKVLCCYLSRNTQRVRSCIGTVDVTKSCIFFSPTATVWLGNLGNCIVYLESTLNRIMLSTKISQCLSIEGLSLHTGQNTECYSRSCTIR